MEGLRVTDYGVILVNLQGRWPMEEQEVMW
jgi:hypothetical protein